MPRGKIASESAQEGSSDGFVASSIISRRQNAQLTVRNRARVGRCRVRGLRINALASRVLGSLARRRDGTLGGGNDFARYVYLGWTRALGTFQFGTGTVHGAADAGASDSAWGAGRNPHPSPLPCGEGDAGGGLQAAVGVLRGAGEGGASGATNEGPHPAFGHPLSKGEGFS